MVNEVENEPYEQPGRLGSCLLWFFWGASLSVTTLCSLSLLALLVASVGLNVYLGWELAGLELVISRPGAVPTEATNLTPPGAMAAIITSTPPLTTTGPLTPAATVPSVATQANTPIMIAANTPTLMPIGTPTPASTASALIEAQMSTLAAIATEVSETKAPLSTPTGIPATSETSQANVPPSVSIDTPAPETPAVPPAVAAAASSSSTNTYTLIPLDGARDSRPADEHPDLNLKLRGPQPIDAEPVLVDIPGSGIDPDPLRLSDIFEPNFVATYGVHDWDWDCDCKGELIQDEYSAVLVGIQTTPGEPVLIPPREQDIYDGKYYAVVLYASEDSLTFLYARNGTVVKGYTVHYEGLQTDPNLLALYRQSEGNELPGLTLDTPVGIATDELLVAIRDNGKFLDVRSRSDWWER